MAEGEHVPLRNGKGTGRPTDSATNRAASAAMKAMKAAAAYATARKKFATEHAQHQLQAELARRQLKEIRKQGNALKQHLSPDALDKLGQGQESQDARVLEIKAK